MLFRPVQSPEVITKQNHAMNTTAVIRWSLLIYKGAVQNIPWCSVAACKCRGHYVAQGKVGEALLLA